MSQWTQPCCNACWQRRNPGRLASRIHPTEREQDTCCYCGDNTASGIYVREDPAVVAEMKRQRSQN